MATFPMMQGFADSEMPEGQPGRDSEGGQIAELCIAVMADGTLAVYKDAGDSAGQEGGEQESPRQPAGSIGEALKMVLDLYKAIEPGNSEAAFQAGYSADEPQQQRPMGRNMSRGMA